MFCHINSYTFILKYKSVYWKTEVPDAAEGIKTSLEEIPTQDLLALTNSATENIFPDISSIEHAISFLHAVNNPYSMIPHEGTALTQFGKFLMSYEALTDDEKVSVAVQSSGISEILQRDASWIYKNANELRKDVEENHKLDAYLSRLSSLAQRVYDCCENSQTKNPDIQADAAQRVSNKIHNDQHLVDKVAQMYSDLDMDSQTAFLQNIPKHIRDEITHKLCIPIGEMGIYLKRLSKIYSKESAEKKIIDTAISKLQYADAIITDWCYCITVAEEKRAVSLTKIIEDVNDYGYKKYGAPIFRVDYPEDYDSLPTNFEMFRRGLHRLGEAFRRSDIETPTSITTSHDEHGRFEIDLYNPDAQLSDISTKPTGKDLNPSTQALYEGKNFLRRLGFKVDIASDPDDGTHIRLLSENTYH